MIFVTVGTHEQPFDRLVRKIDQLKENGAIQEEVFIQTGYCTYEPTNCTYKTMLKYSEMMEYMKSARIIITHGGPSSFAQSLILGKIPIVVPRLKRYNEHVNDHQEKFVREVEERNKNIIAIYNLNEMEDIIKRYDDIIKKKSKDIVNHNKIFVSNLEKVIDQLVDNRSAKKGS